MTCKCRENPAIPKDKSVDIIVPVSPGVWKIADRYWKDCPVHGISVLTEIVKPDNMATSTQEEDKKDVEQALESSDRIQSGS